MPDWLRDEIAMEQGYTICPLVWHTYIYCDNDCDNCATHKEFVENYKEQ